MARLTGEAMVPVIGFGIGVAISPVPVIGVTLMLFSQRTHGLHQAPTRNAYVVGSIPTAQAAGGSE